MASSGSHKQGSSHAAADAAKGAGRVPSGRTVAVTGATGFVGRAMVNELLSRGHRVRALVRSAEKAYEELGSPSQLASMGVDLVVGDVCDPNVADQLVGPCGSNGACIHLVGIIREVRGDSPKDRPQTFDRMHVQATRTMTEACKRAGVARYIQMSALGVGSEGKSAYQKTKWEGEQIVRRSGLHWTIMRPSMIHGAGSDFIGMLADITSGEKAPWFFIPYFVRIEFDDRLPMPVAPTRMVPAKVQPIAVEDVAFAFAQAIETPAAVGETYNLAGAEVLDWQEVCEVVRDALPSANKRMGTWFVPGLHAAWMAKGAKAIGLGDLLPFDEGQALMAIQDNTADMTKAERELNVRPRGFRQEIRKYAAQV